MNDLFRSPLWLLWGALGLAGLFLIWLASQALRRRALAGFAAPELLLPLLAPGLQARRRWKFGLRFAALAFLFLGLAGPRWGLEAVPSGQFGVYAVLAVDTSASMDAQDVKPSRLERAKEALSDLLDQLRGNRVGIVAFSGTAAIQCPLTTDSDAQHLFLDAMRTHMLPYPGTNIGDAVRLGVKMLSPYPGNKGLVLLTDGEDTANSDPLGAATDAAAAGVHIYALGIGTPEGEPIPVYDDSGKMTGYKRDSSGKVVVSKLGEETLAQMAKITNGAYYRVSPGGAEINQIGADLLSLDKSRISSGLRDRLKDRSQLPIAAALLLLLIELLIPAAAKPPSDGRSATAKSRVAAAACALALFLPVPGRAASDNGDLRAGNAALEQKDYDQALLDYQDAAAAAPQDARAPYNAGIAQYRAGKYADAAASFDKASQAANPALRQAALYNLGNAEYRDQKFDKAAQDYKQAILADPGDADAVHNLQVALVKLKQPPQKQQQKKQDQKKDQKRDQQQQQKQDQGQNNQQQKQNQPQGGSGMSQQDAQRILDSLKEKERSNFNPDQYNRAGQVAQPGKAAGGEDW